MKAIQKRRLQFKFEHSHHERFYLGAVFSSTLSAPSAVFCVALFTAVSVPFFVALPVCFAAAFLSLPAAFVSPFAAEPEPLTSPLF